MQTEGDPVDFYVRQFTARWYRGLAHLETDLDRFARTYRIPPEQRHPVRTAVKHALLERADR